MRHKLAESPPSRGLWGDDPADAPVDATAAAAATMNIAAEQTPPATEVASAGPSPPRSEKKKQKYAA